MRYTERPDKLTIASDAEINPSSDASGKMARKHSTWRKALLIALSIVFILALGGVFFVNGKLNKLNYHEEFETLTQEEIQTINDMDMDPAVQNLEQRDSGAELAEGEVFENQDIVNILVCGTDMRIPFTKDPGRCDATVIVSLNKRTGDVKLISFERSIGIPTPKYGDTKLNNAFHYGGAPYMQETITKCFRVDLAGYVHLSYESIVEIFDAIGGIDVELDQSEVYHIGRYVQYDPEKPDLKVGMNHLTGWAAYGYCRLRAGDDNYERQHRVRNAMQAMVEKLKGMSISELNTMADQVLPLIGTNLSKTQISSLILLAPKFSKATVEQLPVPTKGEGWSYMSASGEYMLGLDYTEWSQRIRDFILEEAA